MALLYALGVAVAFVVGRASGQVDAERDAMDRPCPHDCVEREVITGVW